MAYATVEELAAALRIRVNADNTASLQACLDAAAVEIDHDIDPWPVYELPTASWLYSAAAVAENPGDGYFRTDKASPAATKLFYVSTTDVDDGDQSTPLLDASVGTVVRLADDLGGFDDFTVTAAVIDRDGWVEVPVTRSASSGLVFSDGATIDFAPAPITETANPLANRVNVLRAVEWYKAQDAAFGVIGFDQTGALQAPRDGFNRHAYTLTPLKQQWGIA